MMKKLPRLAMLALLFTGEASAQSTGSITGVVTDGASGQPVIGAVVVATSPAAPGEPSAVTDAKGSFTIASLPAGQYKLQASFEGYTTETRADLALGENVTLRANLAIVPEAVQVEEVVVTGSRVKRKDLTTAAPVTMLSRESLQQSGKLSIGDYLQTIPENGGAINAQFNNRGDGTTEVSLRNLGSARTLVLVNGRRFVPGGSGAGATVDLNTIPAAAVERIEVLKAGASAVYGSDAIAGVVNIITKKRFSGTEATAYAGTSTRSDGQTYDLAVTTGTGSETGNILFSIGYTDQAQVMAGDRDFSKNSLEYNYRTGATRVLGSSAIPEGFMGLDFVCGNPAVDPNCDNPLPVPGGTPLYNDLYDQWKADGFANNQFYVSGPNDQYSKYTTAANAYNFQPANYLYTPTRRLSFYSTGDTNLGSAARGYFEASFVNRQTAQQLAPEPIFTVNGVGTTVSKYSQYNPMGVDLFDVRRRMVEFGPRSFSQETDTFRTVIGLDGALGDWAGPLRAWSWDASYNFGRTQGVDATQGTLRAPKLDAAIGPSKDGVCYAKVDATDPANLVYSNPIAGCVPLNLLGGAGTVTPEMAEGLGFYGADRGFVQQEIAQVSLTGGVFKLRSDRPVGLAVGYDHRRESGARLPNPITASGENSGSNYDATQGAYTVNEGFAELVIPILANVPFVHDLELSAAARVFEYSTFGQDSTYEVGLRYSPVRDATLRGTYATAFRAPSIGELYSGQADDFQSMSDPCAGGASLDPAIRAQCNADGVPASLTDARSKLKARVGANPDLNPETATIITAGLVVEPRWVPNLTVTVGWYDITVEDSVSALGGANILNFCYSGTSTRQYCDKIRRDPNTFLISSISDLDTNVGGNEVSGIDFAVKYAFATESAGRFGIGADTTFTLKFTETKPNGQVIDGLGTYDLGTYLPDFKGTANVTWQLAGFGAGLAGRYVGSGKECSNSSGVSSATGKCYLNGGLSRTIESNFTLDAFVTYSLRSSAGKTGIQVGGTNLLDQAPASIYSNSTYMSAPSTYDFRGRFLYARVSQSF